MDAVQEFSVQQSSVDAEFGHSAGGILSVGMKSGTNDIHGTAYYFGRNPALNAVVNPITRTPNFIRNHIWGGTAGAPIIKNKLFTFMACEQWRTKEPRDTLRRMPTDFERVGDFSRSLNRSGSQRTIFDPTTTVLDVQTNTASRQPFPGNVIPPSRVDPTAALNMKDIWGPNGPGDDLAGSNNFKTSYSWPMKNLNISDRTDWNINDKWKVFGRYSNNSRAMSNDNGGTKLLGPASAPLRLQRQDVARPELALLETRRRTPLPRRRRRLSESDEPQLLSGRYRQHLPSPRPPSMATPGPHSCLAPSISAPTRIWSPPSLSPFLLSRCFSTMTGKFTVASPSTWACAMNGKAAPTMPATASPAIWT